MEFLAVVAVVLLGAVALRAIGPIIAVLLLAALGIMLLIILVGGGSCVAKHGCGRRAEGGASEQPLHHNKVHRGAADDTRAPRFFIDQVALHTLLLCVRIPVVLLE